MNAVMGLYLTDANSSCVNHFVKKFSACALMPHVNIELCVCHISVPFGASH